MTPEQRTRVYIALTICGTLLVMGLGCLGFVGYVNTITPPPAPICTP